MTENDSNDLHVMALYCFAPVADPEAFAAKLRHLCEELAVKGTLLIATEGLNGTVAGSDAAMATLLSAITATPGFENPMQRHSRSAGYPFKRLKVKVKKEIVTLGVPGVDAASQHGTHLTPEQWDALCADPDTIIIDTRNDYEVAIGTFKGALDPHTNSFTAFPAWFDERAAQWKSAAKPPKFAMFCTGGIRCEKATAFVKSRGFDDVFHLEGGILRYLEERPDGQGLFEGDCFVFDERVALGAGLETAAIGRCKACGGGVRPDAETGEMPGNCPRCGAELG